MNGTGVPVVTPFEADGAVATEDLQQVVSWLEDGGVDFLVPCGSTSEAPLLSPDERIDVVETVADATDLPVVAGTGAPSYRETYSLTRRAAEAGADAALVVTPYYYAQDQNGLAAYYRELAEESPLPVYLYSVPKFTGVALDPETVADVATHENVAGIKDSTGDLERIGRTVRATADEEFDVLCGSGSVYAHALDAGADGGVLALANLVPEQASEVFDRHRSGRDESARERNEQLVPLDRAITARYGVPGLKAALKERGVPAGRPRRPLEPVGESVRTELRELLEAL